MARTICVVGAGLAGGIVASELAARGHRVTLLEQGAAGAAPLLPDDEVWDGLGRPCTFTRGQGIGGSTNFWHGGIISLDPTDVDGLPDGHKLPIGWSVLKDYYERALTLVSGGEIGFGQLAPCSCDEQPLPLADERFELKPLFLPARPFSTKPLVEAAVAQHGLEVLPFVAHKLVLDGDRATAVEGQSPGESGPQRVEADVVVLCAGGFGSPKILLKSARQTPELGQLPIGRNIIDHPSGFVFKAKLKKRMHLGGLFGRAVAESPHYRRRWGIKFKPEHLAIAGDHNHALYLRPAFSMRDPHAYNELKNKLVRYRGKPITLLEKAQILQHADLAMEALLFHYGVCPPVRYVSGFVVAEQLPQAEHRIELMDDGRFNVRWGCSTEDQASLDAFVAAFLESHHDLFDSHVAFTGLLDSGAHHSGGCRMAETPGDGVVDRDMRVFGTSNVFVSDGSVLGYSGHANTGLTIAALALRCCDTIGRDPSGETVTHVGRRLS